MSNTKVRLSLCPNSGKGRGTVQHAILSTRSVEEIRKICANKFNVKKLASKVRIFSTNNVENFRAGTEITEENVCYVFNDMQITVALKGEDFISKDGRATGETLKTQLKAADRLNIPPTINFPIDKIDSNFIEENEITEETNNNYNNNNSITEQYKNQESEENQMSPPKSLLDIEIEGEFPILEGNVLDCIRKSIANSNIFFEKRGNGYIAFDYKSAFHIPPDTFPPFKSLKRSEDKIIGAIRRECRGLILCASSGHVIARRFHKFFNLNEQNETKIGLQPISSEIKLFEKYDGSLVSPVRIPSIGSQIFWMTKSVVIDLVDKYVKSVNHQHNYVKFAEYWIDRGYTPLFEWCDSNRVVGQILYAESKLILTSIRNITTGKYLPRIEIEESATHFNIPLAEALSLQDFGLNENDTFNELAQKLHIDYNREGLVALFPNGNMIKLKTLWYVSLASASKSAGQRGKHLLIEILKNRSDLSGVPRHVIFNACFDSSSDDVIATSISLLEKNSLSKQAHYLKLFHQNLTKSFYSLLQQLLDWGKQIETLSRNNKEILKSAVIIATSKHNWPAQLASVVVKGNTEQATVELLQYVKSLVQKKSFSSLESLLKISWDFSDDSELDSLILSVENNIDFKEASISQQNDLQEKIEDSKLYTVIELGKFDTPSQKLREFVIEKYLPKKVGNYLGISHSSLSSSTEIKIPHNYQSEEGKIKGMWEQFEKEGIIDLRVDIQPSLSTGFTDHYGDENYCHLQVQYGASKVCKRSSRAKKGCERTGAFAAILIQTNRSFTLLQLQTALRMSFESHRIVILGDVSQDILDKYSITIDEEESTSSIEPLEFNNGNQSPVDGKSKWQIYCDLDGVLANFDLGFQKLTDKLPSEISVDYLWKRILTAGDFFAQLEPYPHTQQLWSRIKQLGGDQQPIILSGLPATKYAKKVAKQKKDWCWKYLDKNVKVITCMSKEKYFYSGHYKILIDDRISLKENWEKKGGIFIYHTNIDQTLWKLNQLFEGGSNEELLKEGQMIVDKNGPLLDKVYTLGESTQYFQASEYYFVSGHNEEDKFIEALSSAKIIGFDAEWRPDELINRNHSKKTTKSAISLIQIAISPQLSFVVDMMNATQSTIKAIEKALSKKDILKIGYGLEEDIKRLNMSLTIEPIIDLQLFIPSILPLNSITSFSNTTNLSLSITVPLIMGVYINKSKAIQASDWEQRPLTSEQLLYAATDASVLFAMYLKLSEYSHINSTMLHSRTALIATKEKGYVHSSLAFHSNENIEVDNRDKEEENELEDKRVVVIYSAIELSEESKLLLHQTFPPTYHNKLGDHITIAYKPTYEHLYQLPVGKQCKAKLYHKDFENDRVQCVPALNFALVDENECHIDPFPDSFSHSPLYRFFDDRIKHVTLSTNHGAFPAESNPLLQSLNLKLDESDEKMQGITVSGRIILKVEINEDSSIEKQIKQLPLANKIIQKVLEFVMEAQVGENLRFKADDLSASERSALHDLAESIGFQSRSEGKSANRRLIITKTKNAQSIDETTTKMGSGKILYINSSDSFTSFWPLIAKGLKRSDRPNPSSSSIHHVDGYVNIANSSIELSETNNDIYNDDDEDDQRKEGFEIIKRCTTLGLKEEERVVIIMRGLPGSGKSSFAKIICSSLSPSLSFRIVSADEFFYRGAGVMKKKEMKGMSDSAVYAKTFQLDRLGEAHEFSRSNFDLALKENVNLIIVDNCNSKLSDFAYYLNAVKQSPHYQLAIVEMKCEDDQTVRTFQSRGAHSVPLRDMLRIYHQWEPFPSSLIFSSLPLPSQSIQNVCNNLVHLDKNITLQRWISLHHIAHYSKSRRATHLSMAIGNKSAIFLDVPDSLEDQFYQVYLSDRDSHHYLMELCSPVIKLFFDIDFVGESVLLDQQIREIVSHFQSALQSLFSTTTLLHPTSDHTLPDKEKFKAIVTGYLPEANEISPQTKSGAHITFPHLRIDLQNAKECRRICVAKLRSDCSFAPSTSWENTVDDALYSTSRGLRMFGSRKVNNKGVDMGRLYQLLAVIDGEGIDDINSKFLYSSQLPSLLRDISIRTNVQ